MTGQLTPPARAGADEELFELVGLVRRFAATMSGSTGGRAAGAQDWWDGICEIGLERCLLPEHGGGIDLPPSALPALLAELAAGDGAVALRVLLSNIALDRLVAAGRDPAGDELCVFVPAAGVRAGEAGLLTGAVPLAYGAGGAARLVICAGLTGEHGLFAVDASCDGVLVEPAGEQLGLEGAPAARITLDGTVGEPLGGGDDDRSIVLLHAGVAAIARGIARQAEAMALAYAEQRYQGGGAIIGHGAVREMLARMAERRLACSAAGPGLPAALAARLAATDAAVATTTDAVQVFGGMGYMVETGVERLMRDAKACQLYPASNWLLRDRLLELRG